MTVSDANLLPEQCAVLRTLCLYALSYPDSLLNLRIVAILSTSRRSVLRHVGSRRVAFSVRYVLNIYISFRAGIGEAP